MDKTDISEFERKISEKYYGATRSVYLQDTSLKFMWESDATRLLLTVTIY